MVLMITAIIIENTGPGTYRVALTRRPDTAHNSTEYRTIIEASSDKELFEQIATLETDPFLRD